MSYRVIQIHIKDKELITQVQEILKDSHIIDHWHLEEESQRKSWACLVRTQDVQHITDKMQTFMGMDENLDSIGIEKEQSVRIVTLPVETVLPKVPDPEETENSQTRKKITGVSREELYLNIARGAELDQTFVLLTVFSTIVAAIGLLEDNVAVIIGAMVIAPLLGPNLAMALSTALGDRKLMVSSLKANGVGVAIAFALSYIIGLLWPYGFDSPELLSRTHVGFDGVILAIVSGAAAVLSLTTGASSVLVGVMVAVALLPPTAAIGLMLGAGEVHHAMGAALLLAVNVVCVNLSAKLVFLFKGVRPRSWFEQEKAKQSMTWYLAFWGIALVILATLIWLGVA